MANCCICSKKIGMFDYDVYMVENNENYKLCSKCTEIKSKLFSTKKEEFIEGKGIYNRAIMENTVDKLVQDTVLKIINEREQYFKEKELEEEQKLAEQSRYVQEQVQKFKDFKATTSMSFEGYKIVEYLDILSGEVVLGTGMFSDFDAALSDFFGTNATSYSNKLTKAKNEALNRLKVNCIDMGANGVIAVDIDITTIGSNMIVACANGTAVKIEKVS